MNDYDILMEKYLKAKDEIAMLLERDLERDKRDHERTRLILQALRDPGTVSMLDFIKILKM
jgi:hypothetical protein